jgi:hypothetical protein
MKLLHETSVRVVVLDLEREREERGKLIRNEGHCATR